MSLPHLDKCKIPIPSEIFQRCWFQMNGAWNENFEHQFEDDLQIEEQFYKDFWVLNVQDPYFHSQCTAVEQYDWEQNEACKVILPKNRPAQVFEGVTCGDHSYTLEVYQDGRHVITLPNEESEHFYPLIHLLNEYADEFGFVKCEIVDRFTTERPILDKNALIEHFTQHPLHGVEILPKNIFGRKQVVSHPTRGFAIAVYRP